MSLCRKFVSEDSHAVARKKQRKWREALNIPDPNSGSQDREKKRQPYVCVASQSNRFLYCFFFMVGIIIYFVERCQVAESIR